jgi:hypothetical protein
MLKVFAFIVIAFFASLWASGNNLDTFKSRVDHWADASGQLAGGSYASDWGTS